MVTLQSGCAMTKGKFRGECSRVCHFLILSRDSSYKALKIRTRRMSQTIEKEVQVMEYLASQNSVHVGQSWVREACDTFQIDVPGGSHTYLVYEPLGISLSERIDLQPGKRLKISLVKVATYCLLLGIDYLHSSGVIHTGKYSILRQDVYSLLTFSL